MLDFDTHCAEMLNYLYVTVSKKYADCDDSDRLVQETMLAYLYKIQKGEAIEYPKGFLSVVLQHKYNDMLREKYRNRIVSYDIPESIPANSAEEHSEEYEQVRKQIGRLTEIFREVTVRYYMKGQNVEQIAAELDIPKGTVMSRLFTAREQIKKGLNKEMEKYSKLSYEPKMVSLGIWGGDSYKHEPFSLLQSPIEQNILVVAYEKPISVKDIADIIGIPCPYIEPAIEKLVAGELLGRTNSGLVYTRCYMEAYSNKFGNTEAQEKLARANAKAVWNEFWRCVSPMTNRGEYALFTDKQKATFLLFTLHHILSSCVQKCRPDDAGTLPERPNGGRWLATATVYEKNEGPNSKYDGSGPVTVTYRKEKDCGNICILKDRQSVFGDAHWVYGKLKYSPSLHDIARFYASFVNEKILPDNKLIYELVPEFEKLNILRRDSDGKVKLDIPALSFDEAAKWEPIIDNGKAAIFELVGDTLKKHTLAHKNKVPKTVDSCEHYIYTGALGAYPTAQILAIIEQGLFPYPVEIGKTPLIYLSYKKD